MELKNKLENLYQRVEKLKESFTTEKALKNIIISFFISLIIFSCKEADKKDYIKKNIETFLKTNMDNPDSYEFVSLKIDTIFRREVILDSILLLDSGLTVILPNPSSESYSFEIKHRKKTKRKIKKLKEELEKTSNNKISRLNCLVKYRGTNSFNAKVLNKIELMINKDNLSVIGIVK